MRTIGFACSDKACMGNSGCTGVICFPRKFLSCVSCGSKLNITCLNVQLVCVRLVLSSVFLFLCYRPLDPGTSPLRSTGISAARTTQWSWMTPSSGKIGLVLLVYASPDVDGLHESPCDSAPMYVTRSPVSSCPAPCAQYPVPCTL